MTAIRVGLIGAGKHGGRYARHIRDDLRGEVRLVALARRDTQKAAAQAEEFNCRAYADYRELIAASDIDAVIAVVPPTMHPSICAEVVAARKPALFEKPAAASVDDARSMLRIVAGSSVPVMVSQTLRYNSVVRAIVSELAAIGPIHALRLSQRFEPSPLSWIDLPEMSGGGMVLHTGVHSFDLLRCFTGREVERVYCETARVETERTEDNFAATVRLNGDILAAVAGSRATHSRSGPIEIAGQNGMLRGDHVHGTLVKVVGMAMTPLPVDPPAATVREVVRDFAAALRASRPVPIPLLDGLRAVAVADACYRSAEKGQAVTVDDLGSR